MRAKIMSLIVFGLLVTVFLAGVLQAVPESAEAPVWEVGDKWALGAEEDLGQYCQPYVDMIEQEAQASPEPVDVDVSLDGNAGVWFTAEVTAATDNEYTLHYRMSESVALDFHASATGMMPQAGTYSYSDTPPETTMTMSVDATLDHATVVSGDIKFVKDTMAVKSVTIDAEQKTAFDLEGKNLPPMDDLFGTGYDDGWDDGYYDDGYDWNSSDYSMPQMDVSFALVDNDYKVTVDSLYTDDSYGLIWGNINIDVYDVDYNLIESVYGINGSTTFVVYHSDGSLAADNDVIQVGDYIIVNASTGAYNLDFYYQDDYFGLVYLDSVYFSSTRDIKSDTYTVSYEDYDISVSEEFTSHIEIVFNPPLNLLDFPIFVGDQWRVYSNITVSGTYGGTIDATGLPDEIVQEVKNETGQDFPIDIAKLDTDSHNISNGIISGSDTVDFDLECTGTMQITDEDGNTLTVFKISPVIYSIYREDSEPSVLYSPDKKFIAGTYVPAGGSPLIPGMDTGFSGELSMLGTASTSDTTLTYVDYNTASTEIDETDTHMSSIGETDGMTLDLSNPMVLAVLLGVVILVVVLLVVMRRKPKAPQQMYPPQGQPQQPYYQQPYQQAPPPQDYGQPQQPYYPPPQPQTPPGDGQTPPPPTY